VSLVTALSFATALGLTVFSESHVPTSAGPDGFSPSAVGHLAFVRFLERLGIQVVRSRHQTARRAPPSALLVIAEPDLERGVAARASSFEAMLARVGPVLVVCPKWDVSTDDEHPGWISGEHLRRASLPDRVLEAVAPGLRVVRPQGPLGAWNGTGFPGTPTLPKSPQLLVPDADVEPLLATPQGILLARVTRDDDSTVHVLSDPDLLSAQGLVLGDNALLVAHLVESLRPEGGAVVLDETLHGHEEAPSVWRALLTWPLVVPVGLSFLGALVLAWAGSRRFGAPLPEASDVPPGKRFLIENTADLLRSGGHAGHALTRYFAATVQDVTRATHAPPGLDAKASREWLDRVGEGRRITTDLEALREDVESASARGLRGVLEAATRVHTWRKEMTDGSRDDS
jgi:hypothetical protein